MDGAKLPIILKKGAEATLYLANWQGRKVIIKKRLPKKYRSPKLDERIKAHRTIHETRLIHEAKKAGVPTPTIFLVDVKTATIIMEFINGKQVKKLLGNITEDERRSLCRGIGEQIGKLHKYGLIHGDLTTSNMIVGSEARIFFVDFGLGEKSKELEARGVDLHLMKRAFESTHSKLAFECFNTVIEGYSQKLHSQTVERVLSKVKEIEMRGRYVAERKE